MQARTKQLYCIVSMVDGCISANVLFLSNL